MSSGQATVSDHGGCAALLSAEDLPDGLVVADDQGRVITFNRMAARLTGVPADHALGKDFRDVLPLHDPEGRDWWKCHIGLCPVGIMDFESVRHLFALDESHVLVHSLLGGAIDQDTDHSWSALQEDYQSGTMEAEREEIEL